MITGRQALSSIDKALKQAHERINTVEREVAGATDRILALQTAQSGNYRRLAGVRVDRLADEEMDQQFDYAEKQVVALLEERNNAIGQIHRQISDAQALYKQYETDRHQQAMLLDEAVRAVDEAEANTQARLEIDKEYIAQRLLAEQAERKALHAEEKATRSEEEKQHKGAAYERDALFSYLWERRYGLPEYKAGGLARWLDGKIARMVAYADARANYARLTEIPLRLQEHAEHLGQLADEAFLQLRQLDEAAMAADGIPDLEARVTGQQDLLEDIDKRIQLAEENDQELLKRKAEFAAGGDQYTERAVKFMADEFRREELVELRRDAINTPYPEDDLIVSQMLQLEDEQQRLESSITGMKSSFDQQQQRLVELESLRIDFKRKRYDREGSVFNNNSMVGVLLGQFLAGLVDRNMIWKVIKEQQRFRPKRSNPGFGSGGFGKGTVWKSGMDELGKIIIDEIGRSVLGGRGGRSGGAGRGRGSRSRGGFRTGGGF